MCVVCVMVSLLVAPASSLIKILMVKQTEEGEEKGVRNSQAKREIVRKCMLVKGCYGRRVNENIEKYIARRWVLGSVDQRYKMLPNHQFL